MKKKILLVYTNFSSFVRSDFDILSSAYMVEKYQFKPVRGMMNTFRELVKQLLYLLMNIRKFDAVYIWFADFHSLLPVLLSKLMRKKAFLVIGGYDVARMPELNYGVFNSAIRGCFAVSSMRHCTLNLPVSHYVERRVKWIAPRSNMKMIYNCVNIQNDPAPVPERENLIMTVGLIDSERTFYLKGIDTFMETARHLPNYRFMIIGADENIQDKLFNNKPANLEVTGRVNHDELQQYYKRATVYCQFSRSESFGVSIVEAMSFGCIPIVTNVGGMPELVVEHGYVVSENINAISELIVTLFQNTSDAKYDPLTAEAFSYDKRQNQLKSVVERHLA